MPFPGGLLPGNAIAPQPTGGYVVRSGLSPYALERLTPPSDPFCCATPIWPSGGGAPSDSTLAAALPYDFPFFGTLYPAGTRVGIDSNGAITLGSTTAAEVTRAGFPSDRIPPAMIGPLWGSLVYYAGSYAGASAGLEAGGNYVVRFTASPGGSVFSWAASETTLYPSGRIRTRYAADGTPPADLSIGVQDASRRFGQSPDCSPHCDPFIGQVVTFYPPGVPHADLTITSTGFPRTAPLQPNVPTMPITVTYTLRNTGTATAIAGAVLLARSRLGPADDGQIWVTSPFELRDPDSGAFVINPTSETLLGPAPGPAGLPPGGAITVRATFDVPFPSAVVELYAVGGSVEDDDGGRIGPGGVVEGLYGSLDITSTSLPDATVGQPFTATLVSDALTGATWSATELPPGLVLSASGVLSGVPASSGVFAILANASAPYYISASQAVSLRVLPPGPAPDAGTEASDATAAGDGGAGAPDSGLSVTTATCVRQPFWAGQVALAELPNGRPVSIVLDRCNVYWTDSGNGGVRWVSKEGGPVNTLAVPTQPGNGSAALAIDSANLYWTEVDSAGAGTVVETRLLDAATRVLGSEPVAPSALAVDSSSVYFSGRAIARIPIGGGPTTTLAATRGGYSLTVTASAAYWAPFGIDALWSVGLAAGAHTSTFAVGAWGARRCDGSLFWSTVVTHDATDLYWGDTGSGGCFGALYRTPLSGGPQQVLTSGANLNPEAMALSGAFLYLANSSGGTILEIDTQHLTVTTLASGQGLPTGIAVDDRYVYWANNNGGQNAIMRRGK
jgi:hypothetical protein